MMGFSWIVNAVKAALKPGRVVTPSPRGFDVADLFGGDLRPDRLAAILREAANGDPERQSELFDFMLETDPDLRNAFEKRKMALTGLQWELVAANEVGRHPNIDEKRAQAARDFCAEALANIDGFDEALSDQSEAIGRGIRITEVEYKNHLPVAVWPIADCLIRCDAMNPKRLRIASEGNWQGVAVDEFPVGKFLVHAPQPLGGLGIRGALLRPATLLYCGKRFGIKAWLIYNELFGQPILVGKYGSETDEKVRSELTKLIKNLGAARGGMFPQGTELEILEAAAKGELPQKAFADYADARYAILFQGQTLTTRMDSAGGSFGAAKVHENVVKAFVDRDIADEGRTLRRQLLTPLVRNKFGDDAQQITPYFRRVVEEATDLLDEAELIDRAVNRLGAKVPKSIVQDQLGIRLVDGEKPEEPLPGAVGADPFQNDLSFHSRRLERLTANRTLARIVKRKKTPAARMSSWIMAAVLATTAHTANALAVVQSFIEKRRDSAEVLAELPAVFESLPTVEMQALAEHALLAGKLAGMADARDKIESTRVLKDVPRGTIIHEPTDFNRIPFELAIERLRDRIGVDPETFELLEVEARSRAWRVAGVHDMSLLATIHQALVKSIAEGETSREFQLRLPAMAEAKGWFGENPYHADLVQFQNFMMSHSAGRYAEYREFGAAGWRFVSNGDACALCAPYVNKVFRLDDRKAFPPIHFWCDCEDEVIFDGEVDAFDASGKIQNAGHDEELAKPKGFKWDPAAYANLGPLKLGAFPAELQPEFRKFGERLGWEIEA